MIDKFIMTKSDKIDVNTLPSNNKLDEITTSIVAKVEASTGDNPIIDTITAIEEYNANVPLYKKITYFLYIEGTPNPIMVLHSKINANYLVATVYSESGYPSFKYSDKSDGYGLTKMDSANQGYVTHIIPKTKLCDIAFGSYDNKSMETILKDPSVGRDTSIQVKLKSELTKLNSLKASGQYRSYIIEFSKFMNLEEIKNSSNYEYNLEACNLYNQIWADYLNTIKGIIGRLTDKTNEKPLNIGLYTDADGNEIVDNYQKIYNGDK